MDLLRVSAPLWSLLWPLHHTIAFNPPFLFSHGIEFVALLYHISFCLTWNYMLIGSFFFNKIHNFFGGGEIIFYSIFHRVHLLSPSQGLLEWLVHSSCSINYWLTERCRKACLSVLISDLQICQFYIKFLLTSQFSLVSLGPSLRLLPRKALQSCFWRE